MTADHLTKPERACTRAQVKVIRSRIVADGGCCYCTRRCHLFDTVGRIAACGLDPPRAFPLCITERTGFDFDEPAYREATKGNPSHGPS